MINVIDIETNGLDPETSEVIEIARCDVVGDSGGNYEVHYRDDRRIFIQPTNDHISVESMAVHHITMDEIMDDGYAVSLLGAMEEIGIGSDMDAVCAHNAKFEQSFIDDSVLVDNIPWICTYKCAVTLWPDAPAHTNQVLRYYLNLRCRKDLASPPHRALPDAYVTAHLLCEVLKNMELDEAIKISSKAVLLPRVTFGKHQGMKWSEVPRGYLKWVLSQDFDDDVRYTAHHYYGG